jgi:hypothetical protein
VAHERGITQARMETALRKCMLDLFIQRNLFQRKMEAWSCGSSRFDDDDDDGDVDGSN